MRYFMAANIQRRKRGKNRAISIAIGHVRAIPESVVVVGAIMNVAQYFGSIGIKAIPTVFFAEIIVSHFGTPVGVGCNLVFVGVYIVPVIVGIGKVCGSTIACSFV